MHATQTILAASLANARVMIQDNMRDSDAWLIRGILAIYAKQTAEEQNTETTRDANGVGFSALDAQILSSFAQQIQRHKADPSPRYKSPLSPRQLEIARNKMHKYAGQLSRIARANAQRAEEARIQADKIVEIEADMGYRD